MSMTIKKTDFSGLEAVEIVTSKLRAVIVTSMGPRIAHFGTRNGRNLLFWDHVNKYGRDQWRLMGGHRIWSTRPMGDETVEAYADDNGPCTVKISMRGVDVLGSVHPVFRISKSIGIKVMADDTLQIENRINNESELVWSGGVWSLTCTLPKATTSYGIPLGREGAWDIFSLVIPKRWAGGNFSKVNDKALRFTEDCLILRPKGKVSKRMVQAPQGLIGMTDPTEKISFLKHSPYIESVQYPWNCNIAYFSGKKNFMVEMEHMGPEQCVLPGGHTSTQEKWTLRSPVDWNKLKGVYKE